MDNVLVYEYRIIDRYEKYTCFDNIGCAKEYLYENEYNHSVVWSNGFVEYGNGKRYFNEKTHTSAKIF